MRRIALANLKGGVGKTATACALAVGFARRGLRTLLVDLDPSGNAGWTLAGGQGADPPTVAEVLTRRASAEDAIRPSATPGLDLLPADAALGGVNIALAQELGRDTRLRVALEPVLDRYDRVIVDTGPTLTTLLVNALVGVEEVIIPMDTGAYAVLGLAEMERIVGEIRDAYNPSLRIGGLLLTKVSRNAVARDVEAELRGRFGPLVFRTTIPAGVAVEAAHTRGLTVLDHAPKSAPALAYLELVAEVESHGERTKDRGRASAGRHPRKVG
jgi:chromosome partitioning protein